MRREIVVKISADISNQDGVMSLTDSKLLLLNVLRNELPQKQEDELDR